MNEYVIYEHFRQWFANQDMQTVSVGDCLRFAKHIAERTRDRDCAIVYGQCGSDNAAARTVEAIRNDN